MWKYAGFPLNSGRVWHGGLGIPPTILPEKLVCPPMSLPIVLPQKCWFCDFYAPFGHFAQILSHHKLTSYTFGKSWYVRALIPGYNSRFLIFICLWTWKQLLFGLKCLHTRIFIAITLHMYYLAVLFSSLCY